MRPIDRMVIRSAAVLPIEELRHADADTRKSQRDSHYIRLAQFIADCGVDSVAGLKASQKREYDRRMKAIRALDAITTPSLSTNAARLRLLNRTDHV